MRQRSATVPKSQFTWPRYRGVDAITSRVTRLGQLAQAINPEQQVFTLALLTIAENFGPDEPHRRLTAAPAQVRKKLGADHLRASVCLPCRRKRRRQRTQ